jgi:hypothetical protein
VLRFGKGDSASHILAPIPSQAKQTEAQTTPPRARAAPRPLVKRAARGRDGVGDVGLVALGDAQQLAARARVLNGQRLAALGVDPFSVDEQLWWWWW